VAYQKSLVKPKLEEFLVPEQSKQCLHQSVSCGQIHLVGKLRARTRNNSVGKRQQNAKCDYFKHLNRMNQASLNQCKEGGKFGIHSDLKKLSLAGGERTHFQENNLASAQAVMLL
jgi:hypothetical protein